MTYHHFGLRRLVRLLNMLLPYCSHLLKQEDFNPRRKKGLRSSLLPFNWLKRKAYRPSESPEMIVYI